MPGISIASNVSSFTAQRALGDAGSSLEKIYQQLSSGLRINKASDDAAGLSIASNLTAASRVYSQGIRNFNDGISTLNIADASIEQLSGIVIRLKELTIQAASGSFSLTQRKAIDAEAQALSQEYLRIAGSTRFNGTSLLNGQTPEMRFQGGYGMDGGITASVGGAVGKGTFTSSVSYAAELSISYSVTLGDLNGDGFTDLVTAGYGAYGNGQVTVRLGLGNGTFGTAASYSSGLSDAYEVSLGDLNGDGNLDLVSAGTAGGQEGVTIRLGNGDGTFGAALSYMAEANSLGLALGDLNGDGALDLVTAGFGGGSGRATVRLGNGNGTFGAAVSYITESGESSSVMLGDLNGDGILDLVTAGYDGADGFATVRLGLGDGTFGSAAAYRDGGNYLSSAKLGDLNNDGKLDLVTAVDAGFTSIRLGNGDGTFSAAASLDAEAPPYSVELGDLNGDGFLDLITAGAEAGSGRATVRLGAGNGTFGTATSFATETVRSRDLALSDLNGDGVLDIVTTGEGGGGRTTIALASTSSGTPGLLPFSLSSIADARQALPVFDRKLEQLAAQRGQIGACQARLSVGVQLLQATKENYTAATSRIQDADIAEASAKLVQKQILLQASSAVLAHANRQPQLIVTLLK